jgi:hypothetical protein
MLKTLHAAGLLPIAQPPLQLDIARRNNALSGNKPNTYNYYKQSIMKYHMICELFQYPIINTNYSIGHCLILQAQKIWVIPLFNFI